MVRDRQYLNGAEFKARQSVFGFLYQSAVEFLQEFKSNCLKGWQQIFRKAVPKVQTQLAFDFNNTTKISTRHFMKLEDQLPKYTH